MMDRAHPIMGNKHEMKAKTRLERERAIDACQKDLEADIKCKSPMHQTMMAIAFDTVDRNDKVGLSVLSLLARHAQWKPKQDFACHEKLDI